LPDTSSSVAEVWARGQRGDVNSLHGKLVQWQQRLQSKLNFSEWLVGA